MRIEQVVINASPLITLFRVGLHPLLSQLFTDLVVPDAVWDEVVSGTHDDPATRGLPLAPWVRRMQPALDPQVTVWNLGAGETAVLSFAHDHPEYTAIVDD
jgi:predicted nucleic acid-binding protein